MARFVPGILVVGLLLAACGEPEPEGGVRPLAPDATAVPEDLPPGAVETPEDLPLVPALALPTVGGDSLRLADLRGNVILLNFWATWCAPCRAEIPDLNRLHRELSDQGVVVVGVALDEGGLEAVRPFAEEFEMAYPVVLDDGTLAEQLGGVYALPTTFVVAPDGTVSKRVMGIFPVERMREELVRLAQADGAAGT